MTKYIVKDKETGKLYAWSMHSILKEINRDRSDEWTNYNAKDWEEGWREWCENDVYNLLGKVNI